MSRKRTRRMTNADTAGKKMPPFWRDGTGAFERWPTVRGRFVSEERAISEAWSRARDSLNSINN